MDYSGPDRRVHRVFVTRNTEYHVRKNTCVAVRDRETGEWSCQHLAVAQSIGGSIRFHEGGGITATPGLPRVGESMYFEAEGRDLVTSSVVSVERPKSSIVASYPEDSTDAQ